MSSGALGCLSRDPGSCPRVDTGTPLASGHNRRPTDREETLTIELE